MTAKTFGSLEKPKKRYVNKQVLRTYRARHEYCETRGGIRGKKLVGGRWVFDSSYYLRKDFADYGSKK
jgi:hypothetical protein